ncbi:hypothetical protein BU26DRAFT_522385 [Trematosphaeria pertusa]|uniref:Uncharacterized protein n=1 Tax=Trematosphaeria pertusa TaxID=390896 RepID=A0A6A6I249_9PLEO|nr:uncharacterized protein BU26DRAFT_522385 [Trematosphaeria pertusa]KAF2244574.1 hypothetical protein BU26DRAFT_522385 [Trematosphaeria pertusa]
MAGFGQQPSAQYRPLTQPLPTGPCNYRDPAIGVGCGCQQFWDQGSAQLHDASKEHRSSSERSTTCVCGHHACFHRSETRASEHPSLTVAGALQQAQASCGGRCLLHFGARCPIHSRGVRPRPEVLPAAGLRDPHTRRLKTSHASYSQRLLRQEASPANGSRTDEQRRRISSQASSSGLPRVPDVCFLSHDRRPAVDAHSRDGSDPSRQAVKGLGLSFLDGGNAGSCVNRQQSVGSTVADDMNIIPSTRANSVAGEHARMTSPARGPLDAVVDFNRNLHLDLSGDTIPNTLNLEDFIQSATEAATPSIANTPDLTAADQALHEGKQAIEGLMRLTSNPDQRNSDDARSASVTSAPAPQPSPANPPNATQERLQSIPRSVSPQALDKLISYLAPLHNLLISIPNVANTLGEHCDRIGLLENNQSFNYVHPDDLQQQLDAYEGRLLEIEHRMDEHDKLHQAIDADHSSNSIGRRRVATISDSFGSNQSLQSTTSSALILAAMDRKEIEAEMEGIRDRLDFLEAAAMPTSLNPWEVEIVLLPWGRGLRGIWFSPDQLMHDPSKATTQDSEEWTQARKSRFGNPARSRSPQDSSPHPGVKRSSRSSHLFSDKENGWSQKAISDWASEGSDELLSPKACGSKNMVYKRLQSRGFIRNVTIKGASAHHIQATLSHAFSDLMEHLRYTNKDEEPLINSYSGLRASFIPLRKVMKESRLRFLDPAEMENSAVWSAQFLDSGVIMRLSDGQKRLYVTQREAYVQSSDQMGSSWTWQEVRQLPRYQADPDSQMEGNEEQCQPQVAEADAREACWAFCEAYDAPPSSVNSSFSSHHSHQLSMRPADQQWGCSITPSSILKNRPPQPISPLSEFHPQRPGRNRTVSASGLAEPPPSTSSKRRLNSSPVKYSSAPHASSRAPSVSMGRVKRRRVTSSSSPRLDAETGANAQVAVWTNTPRRSREPPSPFFSSAPGLPRSNSDATSRPSQRSVAVVGKSTPFAYATPHSGPFLGERQDISGPAFDRGDTEADEDVYQEDDGEQSWRGVTTGDDDSASGSDAEGGAEEPASFSGDDSGFGTDGEEDGDDSDDDAEEEDGFGAQRPQEADDYDEEEEGDVFDTLLGVLEY